MIKELFPLTTLITPNKSEAELLLSHGDFPSKITKLEDMLVAAKNLLTFGPRAVLLKGGHLIVTADDVRRVSESHALIHVVKDGMLSENMEILQVAQHEMTDRQLVVDVLYEHGDKTTIFTRPRIDSTSTHGTGCTLSAALACELSRGISRMLFVHDLACNDSHNKYASPSVSDAVKSAAAYTHLGIETAFSVGKGNGPLNHLHSILSRNLPP